VGYMGSPATGVSEEHVMLGNNGGGLVSVARGLELVVTIVHDAATGYLAKKFVASNAVQTVRGGVHGTGFNGFPQMWGRAERGGWEGVTILSVRRCHGVFGGA
jgi:hypothetical protein